jgi:DNA-binding transcriptional ArsR family regulator
MMDTMTLAATAALLADPTRAAFCTALLDGRAWTAGELARHAGVTAPTASEHLSRLVAGGLLTEERQGRHRYVKIAGPEVAALIEDLAAFRPAEVAPPTGLRDANRMTALARARTCYDHLAGRCGVELADAVFARGYVSDEMAVTDAGRAWLSGIDIALPRAGKRPVVRGCLDWTERRTHLAGALGAALCGAALDRGWVTRIGSGRALRVTPGFARMLT